MSSLIIPPPAYVAEAADRHHAADQQQFTQRQLLPEVLRFEIDTLAATGLVAQVRVPWNPGTVTKVRTYAYAAGSGSYKADVGWADNLGGGHSVFNNAADYITSLTGQPYLVEADPTIGLSLIYDPRETNALGGRFYVNVTTFAGTAWTGVVFEIILMPISR